MLARTKKACHVMTSVVVSFAFAFRGVATGLRHGQAASGVLLAGGPSLCDRFSLVVALLVIIPLVLLVSPQELCCHPLYKLKLLLHRLLHGLGLRRAQGGGRLTMVAANGGWGWQ